MASSIAAHDGMGQRRRRRRRRRRRLWQQLSMASCCLLASLASKLGWCCWLNETSAACDFGGINERGSANGLRPHKVAATSFGIVVWLTEQRLEAAHHWAATGGGGAAVCCLCNLRLVGRSLPPSYVGTIHRRHWTCDQGHRGHTWFSSFFLFFRVTLMRAFWIDEYGSSHVKKRLGFEPHKYKVFLCLSLKTSCTRTLPSYHFGATCFMLFFGKHL